MDGEKAKEHGLFVTDKKLGKREFNYKEVDASAIGVAPTANVWADRGWRVVAVISDPTGGYAHRLLLERPVGVEHPNDRKGTVC